MCGRMGLDIREELPGRDGDSDSNKKDSKAQRRFLSIYWKCCNVYSRVYKNSVGTAYDGNCPRCCRHLSVPIGEEGTSQRAFIAE